MAIYPDSHPFEQLPSPISLRDLNERAMNGLERGDVPTFLHCYKESQDKRRPFSWQINSEAEMVDFCIKNDFREKQNTPEECGYHLWKHENEHNRVIHKNGIPSTIRIAELPEPKHARYQFYVDVDMDAIKARFGNNIAGLQRFMGEVLVAPHRAKLGYKSETNQGKKLLKLALLTKTKSFFRK